MGSKLQGHVSIMEHTGMTSKAQIVGTDLSSMCTMTHFWFCYGDDNQLKQGVQRRPRF